MNAEIRIRWLQIVVRNDYYPDLHRVRRFLENQVQLLARAPPRPAPPPPPPNQTGHPREWGGEDVASGLAVGGRAHTPRGLGEAVPKGQAGSRVRGGGLGPLGPGRGQPGHLSSSEALRPQACRGPASPLPRPVPRQCPPSPSSLEMGPLQRPAVAEARTVGCVLRQCECSPGAGGREGPGSGQRDKRPPADVPHVHHPAV